MSSSRAVPVARALIVAICVGAIAVLAACSGSSKPKASGSTTGSSAAASSSATTAGPTVGPTTGTTATTPAPATTTKATPTTGSAPSTVPSVTITTKPAVKPSQTASFGNGVTIHITAIKSYNAVGHGPGEISGPALAYTLALANGTGKAIDLNSAVVSADYGTAHTPASPLSGSPSKPFTTVAAGKTASGVYCFSVAQNQRGTVTLTISYSPNQPVVVISGPAA